jgi:hypothetical protein
MIYLTVRTKNDYIMYNIVPQVQNKTYELLGTMHLFLKTVLLRIVLQVSYLSHLCPCSDLDGPTEKEVTQCTDFVLVPRLYNKESKH